MRITSGRFGKLSSPFFKTYNMIQTFLITVLVIYGVHATTRGGMIFYKLGEWAYNKHDKLAKVLFDCTPCMASIYGTISFFVLVYPTQGLFSFPVWVFSMCGFNFLINKTFNK